MAAADHGEGLGAVKGGGARDEGYRLLSGVDDVAIETGEDTVNVLNTVYAIRDCSLPIDLVGQRVASHAQDTVLGLEPDLLSSRDERCCQSWDA